MEKFDEKVEVMNDNAVTYSEAVTVLTQYIHCFKQQRFSNISQLFLLENSEPGKSGKRLLLKN